MQSKNHLRRRIEHSGLAHLVFRHRYLAAFVAIGFLSILLEIAILRYVIGGDQRTDHRIAGFVVALLFSFVLNARFNFRVPKRYLVRSLAYFTIISTLSFLLNVGAMRFFHNAFGGDYGTTRLATAGSLFFIAYVLHRRFTFDNARNFGIAVYACEGDCPQRVFETVGHNCDHIHVDLIDETMAISPAPIRLDYLSQIKALWSKVPLSLHIMSTQPKKWMDQTWDHIDWYLLDLASQDDLFDLIFACRERRKKVGVVWRCGIPFGQLIPYLPHVDFVMVLGIREPGVSGQRISPEAINTAHTLDRMRDRYGYDVMFDGGVKPSNVADIPAKYIVAASAVLKSTDPTHSSFVLRTGGVLHERDADSDNEVAADIEETAVVTKNSNVQ